MNSAKARSSISATVENLRALVITLKDGEFLGSEETLQARLNVSRNTVRQAARMLERDGILSVRRGINGGYFASTPTLQTIEAAVAPYMEMLQLDDDDLVIVAAALWVAVLRKAARQDAASRAKLVDNFESKVRNLPENAAIEQITHLEEELRGAMFRLIESRYMEMIYQINVAFSRQRFAQPHAALNKSPEHLTFVQDWRTAKLMELQAIADGDSDLAAMAARHTRNLMKRRIFRID